MLCSSTQPRVSRSVVSMTDRPASHEGHGGGKALGGYAHHDDYAAMFRSRFWMSLLYRPQRERLLEISKRCPVHRTLTSEVVVETELMTNYDASAAGGRR